MKLRSIIVDDEALARENLRLLVEEFCPEIEVVKTAGSVTEAKAAIEEVNPQVVFLDIRMPSGTEGFQLLEQLPNHQFMVVFVTAFKEYAVRAFNANAVHYVLKPVDIDDLRTAINKLTEAHKVMQENPDTFKDYTETLETLARDLKQDKPTSRIVVPHSRGFRVLDVKNIVHLSADNSYTTIHLTDGKQVLDARSLKNYEAILDPSQFLRTHRSHMINLDQVIEFDNSEGNNVRLSNGSFLPISRARIGEFLSHFRGL